MPDPFEGGDFRFAVFDEDVRLTLSDSSTDAAKLSEELGARNESVSGINESLPAGPSP